MIARKTMLIISFSRLISDPRVLKQIHAFKQDFEITTIGFGPKPIQGVRHFNILQNKPQKSILQQLRRVLYATLYVLRMYRVTDRMNFFQQQTLRFAKCDHWDFIIANETSTLSVASKIPSKYGFLADLHEYSPKQSTELAKKLTSGAYFSWVFKTFLPKAQVVTSVSHGILKELQKEYGIQAHLIKNATPFQDIEPTPASTPLKLVHSGTYGASRGIESLIQAVQSSKNDFILDFYLNISDTDLDRLKKLISDDAKNKINIHRAVPYHELIKTLNAYDVGVYVSGKPLTFNQTFMLPNKLFDYVQARLGVIIGPSLEMSPFVEEQKLGKVTDEFTSESLTKVLDGITSSQVDTWKRNSHKAAKSLSSESDIELLRKLVLKTIK